MVRVRARAARGGRGGERVQKEKRENDRTKGRSAGQRERGRARRCGRAAKWVPAQCLTALGISVLPGVIPSRRRSVAAKWVPAQCLTALGISVLPGVIPSRRRSVVPRASPCGGPASPAYCHHHWLPLNSSQRMRHHH